MKAGSVERVTVTLPAHLVQDIDRHETDRSRFVAEAVRHELESRRRAELRLSLDNPHAESAELADEGFEAWALMLPDDDAEALVDGRGGQAVQWVPGEGWREPVRIAPQIARSLREPRTGRRRRDSAGPDGRA